MPSLDALCLVPGIGSPAEWNICFRRTSQFWWARAAAMGRYKHVSCFGYTRSVDGWFFYDFGVNAASVAIIPARLADDAIWKAVDGALVVKWIPPLVVYGVNLKPAFTCVSAVAHLTGVPSCALRPDRFLRDCLAAGAEIVLGEDRHKDALLHASA